MQVGFRAAKCAHPVTLSAVLLAVMSTAAISPSLGASFAGGPPSGPLTPPTRVFTPPTTNNPTTTQPTQPVTPVGPTNTDPSDNSPLMPIDVTHTTDQMNSVAPAPKGLDALVGLSDTHGFPTAAILKGPTDYILVFQDVDTALTRESPYAVTLEKGTILAAVRRPSQTGLVHTRMADIAFSSNSDAFISAGDGITRVRNVDGMGQALKVKINAGPGQGTAVTVAPGYEIVIADHPLTRGDTAPHDGILRRGTHLLTGVHTAVSEFNVEASLQRDALVQHLEQTQGNDEKVKRVVNDMSRMAAVLNQINGTQGFSEQ